MRPSYHVCFGCAKKRITWQFAICTDCERVYGRSAKEWPEWLRISWNLEQQDRRRLKKEFLYEVPLEDDEFENNYE